ncbi:hypothetical protein LUZ63_022550 [Rhynchospora breviuscula]|uniref:Major facilitator superfamily (MFS) profile domain-containing protein n=1 Tax=Rhynchospora breviuscula TaxID=2022672 RepID=A0A9P9Z4K2_9POAL|nr:hypothetical protein LUZ63_022550 [Rhynchospora breviuscula]
MSNENASIDQAVETSSGLRSGVPTGAPSPGLVAPRGEVEHVGQLGRETGVEELRDVGVVAVVVHEPQPDHGADQHPLGHEPASLVGVEAGLVAEEPPDAREPAAGGGPDDGMASEQVAVRERLVKPAHAEEGDVGVADASLDRLLGGVIGDRGTKRRAELIEGVVHRREEEVLLRAEQAHDVRLADPRSLGDLVGRGADVSAGTEHGQARAHDLLSALFGGEAAGGVRRAVDIGVQGHVDRLSVDYYSCLEVVIIRLQLRPQEHHDPRSTPSLGRRTPARRRDRPFGVVVAAASVPMFMATLDNLVMTNALPVLHRDLGATVEELQWFVNAYTLVFAGAILLASALGDRFGRRTVFAIGIAVFGAGSVLAALSTDPAQLIAARALQGLGGAAVMPLSLALVSGGVAPERRPLAIGIWGGVSGLGVAAGPLIGGAVMEGWNWQAIFWINVPVALVALPFALWALRNDRGARERIDVAGVLLVGIGVLALVHAIVRADDDGWGSPSVIGEIAVGVALVAAFVWRQARTSAPIVPLRLFGDRSFTLTNVVGFGFSFGTFGAVFILIQYLQVVQGASPFEAALQASPWTLAPMIVAPLAGIVAPRIGTRMLMLAGLLLQGAALLWLAVQLAPDTPYAEMVAPFVMAGVGMGLVFAPSATALLATLGVIDHAKASGVNSTVREIGIALGTAVLTAIFTGFGGQLAPDLYVDGARPAVLVGALVLFATAVATLWLPAGRSATAVPNAPIADDTVDDVAVDDDTAAPVPPGAPSLAV